MKKIYTLIIILLAITATVKAQVSEQEFQALKALYNATGGDNWTDRTGWENINTTATKDDVTKSWKGIQRIVDGHITQLNFYSNNLTGVLPDEIVNFQYLTHFYVHFNKLQAPLPEALKTIKTLQTVNISVNPLNIPFPTDFISSWPNLAELNVYDCGLTGPVDDVFMHTPLLTKLSIAQNKLTGELPQSLNLLDFVEFDCKENSFTGELPALQNTIQIYRLNLSNNQFAGTIPGHYGSFNLQFLAIQYNNLIGDIPVGLFKAGFNELAIEENYFTFANIEPVFSKLNSLPNKRFSTTKKFPVSSNLITVNAGEPLLLNAVELSVYSLGGNNNRYKWFKNNVEVYSGNSPIYTVENAGSSDAGTYHFEVTNTVVTGVTLKSDNITVSIVGSNQPPTNITLSNSSISENFTGNVGTFTTTDPDAGDTHTYSLATGNGTNDKDNDKFSITGNQLKINHEANFETSPTLNILITANDGNGGIFTKAFVITVNNINEAPVYNGQVTSNSIDENTPNGTTALTLMAQDPEGAPVVFSITAGNEDGAFSIDGNKLIVADNTKLNYDTKKQYNLSVRASDGELYTTAILIISLNKINQMPQVENATFNIDENVITGTVVGSIVATDREGDPLTYNFLTGNELFAFKFNGNTIEVDNTEALDFELHPVFNLTINVSDGISNVQATVTINLNNVSENTDNDILTFSVPEMVGNAVINNASHTIAVNVSDVSLSSLVATFTISPDATSNPVSGTSLDFTTPQTIQVTSQSGATQDWVVTVTMQVSNTTFQNQNLNVYPNPAVSFLQINGLGEASLIRVFNSVGQQILLVNTTNENEQIDISQLKKGNYLLMVESEGKRSAHKFSKL